jgi:hypothetical protein
MVFIVKLQVEKWQQTNKECNLLKILNHLRRSLSHRNI